MGTKRRKLSLVTARNHRESKSTQNGAIRLDWGKIMNWMILTVLQRNSILTVLQYPVSTYESELS